MKNFLSNILVSLTILGGIIFFFNNGILHNIANSLLDNVKNMPSYEKLTKQQKEH